MTVRGQLSTLPFAYLEGRDVVSAESRSLLTVMQHNYVSQL